MTSRIVCLMKSRQAKRRGSGSAKSCGAKLDPESGAVLEAAPRSCMR